MGGQSVLVKFDKTYPYGDQEDEFKEVCKQAHPVANFHIGEVQVDVDGEAPANDDLRKRFELTKDDFPAFFLFKHVEGAKSKDKVKFTGKVTAGDLAAFLRRNGVKIANVGTIMELDEIARAFLKGGFKDSHVEDAKKLADDTFKEDRKAPMYVKIMQKIKEKGEAYVGTETKRLEKILGGQVGEEKRAELSDKVRILTVFGEKDEL